MRSTRTTLASLVAAVAITSGRLPALPHGYSARIKHRPPRDTEQQREIADWNEAVERRKAEKKAAKLKRAAGVKEPAAQPAPQAPLDVCTDPDNCRRCKAAQWDKHKFEHAGIAAGVKEPDK